MRDLFFFDTMLTPKIITIVYWLLLVGVALAGIGTMFTGGRFGNEMTFVSFLMGLGVIIFGAIGARVWSELLIVIFKIHENLKKMAG
ncbi:DUF4282 domain-containing protein [Thioalkalivibrio sp. ALMg13-2]|uniref:DUF4282 domain-containing protein n=1 Tax=Thioalkalivibrio sp. ALMg13-2 TaxID=1158167 RepID=UPI0003693D96|nr:DUF4282 domain-containing protein [Thioalkalivibrio sp. ALMg13-2]